MEGERATERDAQVYLVVFSFSNRVIDRSLSAMNGCKGEGGKNPELQVTDHGSDTARMQTGRGRKIHRLRAKKVHFQKSTAKREQTRFREYEQPNYETKVRFV